MIQDVQGVYFRVACAGLWRDNAEVFFHRINVSSRLRCTLIIFVGLAGWASGLCGAEGSEMVSFRSEVMAVLSKSGCNAGTCHGNFNGKYGFRLSLRGEDPAQDHWAITREYQGRRIHPWDPESSLLLSKAINQIPHQGGQRFNKNSEYYQILARWIEQGAVDDQDESPQLISLIVEPNQTQFIEYPQQSIQLVVKAEFIDGSVRDISTMAVYETSNPIVSISSSGFVEAQAAGEATILIRYLNLQIPLTLIFIPHRPEYVASEWEEGNFIDQPIHQKLARMKQVPAPLCDDRTYLRRVTLDLTGTIPSPQEISAFIENPDPDKRRLVARQLMETDRFSSFWAMKWADLLKIEERSLDRKGVMAFHQWLKVCLANDTPLDEMARQIIASSGSTYQVPATNFYRANRSPAERSVAIAQVFLGTRLQCAECHNHPFDRWSQNDYYSWAAAFASVDYRILENRRRDSNDQHEFVGEQIVFDNPGLSVLHPVTRKPAAPAVLGNTTPLPDDQGRRPALAEWLTSPDQSQFAHVQANRIWSHLMGRGLVDPVDDFRSTNPASHPELLNALTRFLVDNHFQLKPLIGVIVDSHAYQRSSMPFEDNQMDDPVNYARVVPRRLTAEQILDSLSMAMQVPIRFNGYAPETQAIEIPGVEAVRSRSRAPSEADQFLKLFGRPARLLTTDEERTCTPTMTQAFQLVNGPLLQRFVAHPENLLQQQLAHHGNSETMIENLFLSLISRRPEPGESNHFNQYFSQASSRREALEDIAWALINSKEMLFRF